MESGDMPNMTRVFCYMLRSSNWGPRRHIFAAEESLARRTRPKKRVGGFSPPPPSHARLSVFAYNLRFKNVQMITEAKKGPTKIC